MTCAPSRRALAPAIRRALSDAVGDVERFGLTDWPDEGLTRMVEAPSGDLVVRGFPALADEGSTVAIRVFEDRTAQAQAMWAGTRRLLALTSSIPVKGIQGGLSLGQRRALGWSPYEEGFEALFDDVVVAVLDGLLRDHGGPAWDEVAFEQLRSAVRASCGSQIRDLLAVTARVLAADRVLERRIDSMAAIPGLMAVARGPRRPARGPGLRRLRGPHRA